jgi:intergrase/recombinase
MIPGDRKVRILSAQNQLLESGTPIHVVTRLMRHADSKVTLEHYAHIVGDAERLASEKLSGADRAEHHSIGVRPRIGVNLGG